MQPRLFLLPSGRLCLSPPTAVEEFYCAGMTKLFSQMSPLDVDLNDLPAIVYYYELRGLQLLQTNLPTFNATVWEATHKGWSRRGS